MPSCGVYWRHNVDSPAATALTIFDSIRSHGALITRVESLDVEKESSYELARYGWKQANDPG